MLSTLSNMIPTEGIGEHINIKAKDKYIFGNWINCCICGDYPSVNKHTQLEKYDMPLPKEIFHAFV
jgi:hypothetical protein